MFLEILGLYALLSFILLLFPGILHKKKEYKNKVLQRLTQGPSKTGVLELSHRGGSREKMENTIEAFQNAADNGSHFLELDVHLTKDKQVIVCHDTTLTRLCGVDTNVTQINYKDMPPAKDSIMLHFSDLEYFDTTKTKNRQFALLKDVFEQFPDKIIQVDLKNQPLEIVDETYKLIQKYKIQDNVVRCCQDEGIIWGMENQIKNKYLYDNYPEIATFFSSSEVKRIYLSFLVGLIPFMKLHNNSFAVPKYTVDFHKMKLREMGYWPGLILQGIQRKFFNVTLIWFFNKISGLLIKHLQKRGVLVFYWVLNEEEDFQDALNSGVSGIMTDYPTKLNKFLASKGRTFTLKED